MLSISASVAVLQIQVQIGGQAVPNSPCTVSLRPGPVCLDRLQVEGASNPFMAGEEKTIDILTVDAHGHATAQDGVANITVKVASGTYTTSGNSGLNYGSSIYQSTREAICIIVCTICGCDLDICCHRWQRAHIWYIHCAVMHSHGATIDAATGAQLLHLETQRNRKQKLPQPLMVHAVCAFPATQQPLSWRLKHLPPRSKKLTLTCSCCQTQGRCKVQRLL